VITDSVVELSQTATAARQHRWDFTIPVGRCKPVTGPKGEVRHSSNTRNDK